jgi:hypothetical protein
MPLTISGDTPNFSAATITTGTVTTLTTTTISDGTNSTSSTNCIQGSAKAWGKNSGGTSGIVASYNVSSITYTSTGNYTVAFTAALSDANYAVMSGAFISSVSVALRVDSQSTTGFTCETLTNTGSNNNAGWAFSIFR